MVFRIFLLAIVPHRLPAEFETFRAGGDDRTREITAWALSESWM
jgi:hypothetical protein